MPFGQNKSTTYSNASQIDTKDAVVAQTPRKVTAVTITSMMDVIEGRLDTLVSKAEDLRTLLT